MCAFVAFNWALIGKPAFAATQGFGLGLSAVLTFAFFATISPSQYTLTYCDSLSLVTVTAGVIGGIGLAILARISRFHKVDTRVFHRLFGLIILGVMCGFVLFTQAPQCLANPLAELPDDVISLWLNNISEAQSITDTEVNKTTTVPYIIGAPILAVLIVILDIRNDILLRSKTDATIEIRPNINIKFLALALLISGLSLTFYQIRFSPFAYLFAIIPLAGWISNLYRKKQKNPSSVIYLAALVASIPIAWIAPGILLAETGTADNIVIKEQQKAKCKSNDVLKNLASFPSGTIAANPSLTGYILNKTHHRALSGNYHRNWKGIAAQIEIAVSEPVKSGEILLNNKIDYLYFCATSEETKIYVDYSKSGLMAKIAAGDIPNYLEAISPPDLEDGDAIIFKVIQPDL
jgi:hypothetical protein